MVLCPIISVERVLGRRVKGATNASVAFGVIPYDDWYPPEWIDEEKAMEGRMKLQAEGIIYAGAWKRPPLLFWLPETMIQIVFHIEICVGSTLV